MWGHSLRVCTHVVLTSSISPNTSWEGTMTPDDNHRFYLSLHLSLTLIWPRGEGASWCLKVFTSCALRCLSFLTHSEEIESEKYLCLKRFVRGTTTASAEEGQDRLSSGQGRRICYAVLLSPLSEEHTTEYGRPIARLSTESDGREEFRARDLLISTGARHSGQILTGSVLRC